MSKQTEIAKQYFKEIRMALRREVFHTDDSLTPHLSEGDQCHHPPTSPQQDQTW